MKFKDVKIFYALMCWGGSRPGQRPRTALFKIYKQSEDFNELKGARIDAFGHELTRNLTTLSRDSLVAGWVHLPERSDVVAIRKKLRVVPLFHIGNTASPQGCIAPNLSEIP